MELTEPCYEDLKAILKSIRSPGLLDDHPWTKSLIVQERLVNDPRPGLSRPGQQLIHALASLFMDMQPPTPPRRGKRLDPRWGEFGLLAALYFTPLRHGTPFPTSLLDAWRRIDSAILYQVYGQPAAMLSAEQIRKYQLVGDEVDYGSASTLSDWHRKGVQRLAEILANREQYLSRSASLPATIVGGMEGPSTSSRRNRPRWRFLGAAVLLVLCSGLAAGVFKGTQLYRTGRAVAEDVSVLQTMGTGTLQADNLQTAYPHLLELKSDLGSLQQQAEPFLWIGPRLGWVPTYGGDLADAPELLQAAGHLVDAVDLSYQASRPLLDELGAPGSELDPASLTFLLATAQPKFTQARAELDQSLEARRKIDVSALSPSTRELLADKVDPILDRADEGLSLATSLPVLLGASEEGPKTYLLLVQNEDELRSTGGLITSVGRLVVQDGQVISVNFDVEYIDDWSQPYPAAPWQMREYMNSPVVLLRDANWSPDFPTSAQLAETLYAYNHSLSVDGVIAFDQHFLVMLLEQIGPLQVEGVPEPISAENVIAYMRAAKEPPENEPVPAGWHPKDFIPKLTGAVLKQLAAGGEHGWGKLLRTVPQALNERHLLLQFDKPEITSLLAREGWSNTLQPGKGDFLLVTDTNMGFNKTNAVVDEQLSYQVDLTDILQPQATVIVSHANHAKPGASCNPWAEGQPTADKSYPIDRCYHDYLRIYKQSGTALLEANPMAVPGEWMLLGREVPARVDRLEEDLPGVEGVGTYLVLPGEQSRDTRFQFALPPGTLIPDEASGQITYYLKVQKQPGTLAMPIRIEVLFPGDAEILSVPAASQRKGNQISLSTDLQTDVELQVIFSLQ